MLQTWLSCSASSIASSSSSTLDPFFERKSGKKVSELEEDFADSEFSNESEVEVDFLPVGIIETEGSWEIEGKFDGKNDGAWEMDGFSDGENDGAADGGLDGK